MNSKKELQKNRLHQLMNQYGRLNYKQQISNFFEKIMGINIREGSKILEIGAGMGLFSHFLAVYFNSDVVSLDQYEGDGSAKDCIEINKIFSKEIGYQRVKIVKMDFKKYKTREKFNFIIGNNVFHHIINTPLDLSKDNEKFRECKMVFSNIYNSLFDDGMFILTDVEKGNYNINPLYYKINRGVNFKTKQNNWEWVVALKKVGFKDIAVRHLTPRFIREIPGSRFIFNNRFISMFFDSSYVIVCKK